MEGEPDNPDLQWSLFKKYHALGSWKGVWTSYDYIGDVLDETIASVDLDLLQDGQTASQNHIIVIGARRSDCTTCYDSMETKEIPVANYTRDTLLAKRVRLAANSMVIGPSLLRSGVMATEIIVAQGDARVRVIFQHAPSWERGIEPGSCPPQALKLARTMISREVLRGAPPTAETEALEQPGHKGNPVFYRPVPPYSWHKKWVGTSWTWGPMTGNRGWSLEELDAGDDWHGYAPPHAWNLRLPGGIFLQAPRVITGGEVGLCRVAWLPNDDTLLRVEAGVTALQPTFADDDRLVGFEPPSLSSLRCDVLSNAGDLEVKPLYLDATETPTAPLASVKPEEERTSTQQVSVLTKSDSEQTLRDSMQL